jgi:hypothetical protein
MSFLALVLSFAQNGNAMDQRQPQRNALLAFRPSEIAFQRDKLCFKGKEYEVFEGTLNLSNLQINETEASQLFTSLNKLPHFNNLNLSNCGLNDKATTFLANNLPKKLRSLSLIKNQITSAGAIELAHRLPKSLADLFLSRNQIGDEGAIALAQNFQGLTRLDLDFNKIGNKGASGLAHYLPKAQLTDFI